MGQKHSHLSRPNPSSVPHDEQQLTSQQQTQAHNSSQQHPAPQQGYAASPVLQPQYTPPQYAGYTNGALYGGYAAGPYGGMQPAGPHTVYQPPPGPYMTALRPPVPTQAVQQTQTIKNQVNLMKKTLKLEPLPGEPDQLLLKFSFSATAPCRVSTFVLATEDPSQALRIMYSTPELRTPAYYDRGVNQQFPPNDVLAQQHAIKLVQDGVRKEDTLTTTGPASFPLIIRLETLTQQATEAGKDLQQLPIGSPLPEWVQAQCTYAKLKRDDNGKWALQVLKQKIWVDGVSYELHEIYGMEATRTGGSNTASPASEDVDGRECVICMSAPRDTTVLPCRHMCICEACAHALRKQTNKCPICREPMESLLHIKQ